MDLTATALILKHRHAGKRIKCSQLFASGVILLGDCAHGVTPVFGQVIERPAPLRPELMQGRFHVLALDFPLRQTDSLWGRVGQGGAGRDEGRGEGQCVLARPALLYDHPPTNPPTCLPATHPPTHPPVHPSTHPSTTQGTNSALESCLVLGEVSFFRIYYMRDYTCDYTLLVQVYPCCLSCFRGVRGSARE